MTEQNAVHEDPAETAPAIEAVEVVLTAARHEHNGTRYVRGDHFAVPADLVAHLRTHGIAEPAA